MRRFRLADLCVDGFDFKSEKMKEIPILYSTPMIQAKLAGRKTQTRRIVKHNLDDRGVRTSNVPFEDWHGREVKCPYGKPGDLLWARETHLITPGGKYHYKADISDEKDANRKGYIDVGEDWAKWKPSIHMPKGGARIWDRVVSVRVERLQEISEEDAIAEGIGVGFQMNAGWPDYTRIKNGICEVTQDDPRMSYATLWESINGPGSWEANPWVWVITTETLSTTGRP